MAREYIAVDLDTKQSSQTVKLINQNNEFHGTLKTYQDGQMKDVRDVFIQGGEINGTPLEIKDVNGKKILDISFDELHVDEIHTNTIYLDSKDINDLFTDLSQVNNIGKVNEEDFTMNDLAHKFNQLLDILKAASTQRS